MRGWALAGLAGLGVVAWSDGAWACSGLNCVDGYLYPAGRQVPLGTQAIVWRPNAGYSYGLDEVTATLTRVDSGAEVPFERPPELGLDHVRDLPVFEHALEWLRANEGYVPDLVVQLRPTSPIRPDGLIDEAIDRLVARPDADSIRAVCLSQYPPYKMWRIEDGMMQPLLDSEFAEPYNMPRQELPDTFWQTGHVEVIRTATILEMGSMTGHRIAPYVLDPAYAIDLDNELQWKFAEYVLDHWKLEIVKPNSSTK